VEIILKIKNRLDHLDIARGIAIILVVWGHADRRMDYQFYKENLEFLDQIIYSFHIALLFIISGALFRGGLINREFQTIFFRAANSILKPFLALSLAFIPLKLITLKGIISVTTFKELFLGIFFFQSSDWAPSGVLWFLFVLFGAMILTAILVKRLGLSFGQVLCIAIAIKLASPLVNDVHLFAAGKFARNFVFFVVGVYLTEVVKDNQVNARNLVVMCGYCIIFVLFFWATDIYKPFFQLITGIAGSLVVLKLSTITAKLKIPIGNLLRYCGQNSISIFVFHMPSFVFISFALSKLGLKSSYFGFGIFVLMGCTIPLFIELVLKEIPTLYSLLLGRAPEQSLLSVLRMKSS